MPATEAQIRANQANARKSTGPKTDEGKQASRANAYKHGLTGSGTVMPEREAAEIERRVLGFEAELQPTGEVGLALARHAATMSVRMERCARYENITSTDRVRRALDEFVPPEGADEAEIARLRGELSLQASFDPSREASLARKYEAAAERGFFRALKELRLIEKTHKAEEAEFEAEMTQAGLGSFSPGDMTDAEFDAMLARETPKAPPQGSRTAAPVDLGGPMDRFDVPLTIGRRR